ncbi:Gfo/Idh/MocA family protein [Rubripirellula reticaptiva]|uniref:Putative oxidoreductase YhhX n=1 Tax=Rubripirellula reticaptiva TaxID=2528013 RepID=A0A5C6FAU4_9BACT|nr:Gfo/Idh/MocA family oxidoreductase [Rubripirellula reticaptiva]TWU57882.1 putative oxidoreductase YhhX [Rubripirellula reticaptiva]
MRVVFVGCGFVSSFYARTILNYPQLVLAGATDIVPQHADEFCKLYSTRHYKDLDEVLADGSVDAIANLTNPKYHYEVSKAALQAGKHVYSEKPLATNLDHATELVNLAKTKGLQLSSAPCNVLGEAAQTMWKEIRKGSVGKVRLIYAEMDDGLIHQMGCENWVNEIGRHWPVKDEFEVGCTLEHAGYYVSWLVAFFGSVKSMTTFPAVLIADKGTPVDIQTPDFTVVCLRFADGVVARLTCSIVAPHDHQMRVIGDAGTLSVEDCWYYDSPVHLEPFSNLSMRRRKIPFMTRIKGVHPRKISFVRNPKMPHRYRTGGHKMDFARGIAEMADAVTEGRDSRLSADFSLHINEIVLKIQTPPGGNTTQELTTSAGEFKPMSWAT